MSELFFLPAKHGDSFFLHCEKGKEEGWIIVDGGPTKQKNKSAFLQEVEKLPSVDLIVLTHHDEDHIEGILSYINEHKEDKPFPIKKLWVNCANHIDIAQGGNLSAQQAYKLADTLKDIQKNNEIEWDKSITDGVNTTDIKFANIDVLSPTTELLNKYYAKYEEKTSESTPVEGLPLTAQQETDDLNVSLRDLARRSKANPNESNYHVLTNMASITFVLQCDGLSILMLGDCFPQQIVDALTARGITKEKKLKVDFVKVAHHGSKYNISNDLLDLIDCQNYLISTDGGKGSTYHPNREALANVICHPSRNYDEVLHLHFNYSLRSIKDKNGFSLFNEDEEQEYNFKIHEPNENETEIRYRATKY